MRPFLLAILSIPAIGLAACRSDGEAGGSTADADLDPAPVTDVVLRVSPDRVESGAFVHLILRNESDASVGYNLCTSVLERRTTDGWEPVPSERVCTMELRTLSPGERAEYELEIPAGLAEGRYRATTTVERMGAGTRHAVWSDRFQVT